MGLGMQTAHAGVPDTETIALGVTITRTVPGTGAQPWPNDRVKVHYRGTLANGKEFDSTYSRNEPAIFPLHIVIPCWQQAMQKMRVGEKATLTCPAASAYGERGVPGMVPPNADLTFDVELLAIVK